jgi:hypothetical protein
MTKVSSSPRTVRLMTALVLLATFAAGTITGGSLVHWFAADAEPARPMGPLMLPLHELNLSEAQQKKVHAIFESYRPKLEELLKDTFPKVRAVNEQIERDIRGVLTDEQRLVLDRSKRHGPRHDGPPPGGPPPPLFGGPKGWSPGEFPSGPPPEADPNSLSSGNASGLTAPTPVPPATTGQ